MSHKKQIVKKPANDYVKRCMGEKYDSSPTAGRSSLIRKLTGEHVPYETQRKLISAFKLPKHYATQLIGSDYLIDCPSFFSDLIWVADSEHGKELRKKFLPYYEDDCLNVFVKEMGYIQALYRWIPERPTKKDLRYSTNIAIKGIKRHLEGIDRAYSPIKDEAVWLHIEDMIHKAYLEEKKQRGIEPILTFPIQNFFSTVQWMKLALQRIDNTAFDKYKANGREQERRNNALVAMAGSYERCFGTKPTSTVRNELGAPCFADCVRVFLHLIFEDLGEETFKELLKKTISAYKKVGVAN